MRLRRSTLVGLAGVVVATGAVLFFLVTSMQAATLLHDGVRLDATVVRTVPANSWDPIDSGRNVVHYTYQGREYTETIWLDDPANARPAGSTWTVVVDRRDASNIRSLTDDNSPVPVGVWVALVGVAAVAVLILTGIYRFLTRGGRSRSGWRTRRNAQSGLTNGQEVVGILIVFAVDGALALAAEAIGWSWLYRYGRLTLAPPTIATFALWSRYCRSRRVRQATASAMAHSSHVSLRKTD